MKVLLAIYSLQKSSQNGITVSNINIHLGENPLNYTLFVKHIMRLVRLGYIIELTNRRTPIYEKRFIVSELGRGVLVKK